MNKTLITNGDGYEEVTDGDDRVSLHRLVAVAEYGLEAVAGKDVHHKEMFDGRSVPFANAPEWVEPIDPMTHRIGHLDN